MSDLSSTSSTTTTETTKKPIGLIRDPANDFSSKRFESIMSFGMAVLLIIGTFIAGSLGVDTSKIPVIQMLIALLTYSAGQQVTAAYSERNLFPGGANTGNSSSGIAGIVGSLVTKITGNSTSENPPIGK